jgi:hypothetical protein
LFVYSVDPVTRHGVFDELLEPENPLVDSIASQLAVEQLRAEGLSPSARSAVWPASRSRPYTVPQQESGVSAGAPNGRSRRLLARTAPATCVRTHSVALPDGVGRVLP